MTPQEITELNEWIADNVFGNKHGNRSWWCPNCREFVPGENITFEQTHDTRANGCGFSVDEHPDYTQPAAHAKLFEKCAEKTGGLYVYPTRLPGDKWGVKRPLVFDTEQSYATQAPTLALAVMKLAMKIEWKQP